MQKKTLLFIMVFLGLLGLLTSLYLVQHHYALAQESHFCDFSKTVSCTVISQSAYAELFHMPVALYGVFWFIVFLTIVFFVWRKKHSVKKALLLWSSTGVLFIFYLFYAEWRVGAICPWCTLVHLIVLLLFSLTLLLYRRK